MFGVQLYKNNACVLLSRILSILNLDWLQHARSVRGVYECQITNLWCNSGHLDLLFLVATVTHLIWNGSSGWVIFFQFSDPWQSWIVMWWERGLRHNQSKSYNVTIKKILKRLSSGDNSTTSWITEPEEDQPAWIMYFFCVCHCCYILSPSSSLIYLAVFRIFKKNTWIQKASSKIWNMIIDETYMLYQHDLISQVWLKLIQGFNFYVTHRHTLKTSGSFLTPFWVNYAPTENGVKILTNSLSDCLTALKA